MGRRVAAVSALLLVAGLALPAGAATSSLAVHRVGTATAVDVVLPSVTLDWSRAVVSSRGRAVALYVEPLDPGRGDADAASGALVVAPQPGRFAGEPALPLSVREVTGADLGPGPRAGRLTSLRAGRYRLHLLGDPGSSVVLPVRGLSRAVRVQTRLRTRDALAVSSVAPTAPGIGSATSALPASGGTLTRTVTVVSTQSAAARLATRVESCRRQESPPDAAYATCEGAPPADAVSVVEDGQRTLLPVGPVPVPAGATTTTAVVSMYSAPQAGRQVSSYATADRVLAATAVTVVLQRR